LSPKVKGGRKLASRAVRLVGAMGALNRILSAEARIHNTSRGRRSTGEKTNRQQSSKHVMDAAGSV